MMYKSEPYAHPFAGAAKEWEKVVRVYEKGNVFLGEAALALVSNSDYEIPFLRKQATSLNSQLVDLERKSEELKNSARAAAANYKKECQALSIKVHTRLRSVPP